MHGSRHRRPRARRAHTHTCTRRHRGTTRPRPMAGHEARAALHRAVEAGAQRARQRIIAATRADPLPHPSSHSLGPAATRVDLAARRAVDEELAALRTRIHALLAWLLGQTVHAHHAGPAAIGRKHGRDGSDAAHGPLDAIADIGAAADPIAGRAVGGLHCPGGDATPTATSDEQRVPQHEAPDGGAMEPPMLAQCYSDEVREVIEELQCDQLLLTILAHVLSA